MKSKSLFIAPLLCLSSNAFAIPETAPTPTEISNGIYCENIGKVAFSTFNAMWADVSKDAIKLVFTSFLGDDYKDDVSDVVDKVYDFPEVTEKDENSMLAMVNFPRQVEDECLGAKNEQNKSK
ncbi:hypothetical protein [Acinetobacter gyllenbergii]|uniref:hypothetical protein n=1 Tax=Acinetobacter gyllenbergii TaxID=134534 RepID=UPI003F553B4C